MTIAATVRHFLEDEHIGYMIVRHPHTATSTQSATSAHVDPHSLAKAVLLSDERGYLLAVLPATSILDLERIEQATGRHLALAPEETLGVVFDDCDYGAVPPLGTAYGVETLVEESLRPAKEVYFEAGDHEVLLGVEGAAFRQMMAQATFGAISYSS